MADGRKKQAMSLNQLHNRFLHDLSASHSKPKPNAVEDNTQWKVKAVESTEGNDDVPRFDFDTTSPPHLQEGEVNIEEPVSTNIKDSSPQLFAGIADFDSQSPSFVGMKLEHIGLQSSKVSDIEDNASKKKSLLFGDVDHASNFQGRNSIRDEEPKFDGVSDFDSPPQVNKTCESAGNEIRDILNDLSARLEILSIEKKRVPKKVDPMEDFQESTRSKLHDLTIKEGVPEYHNAASSYLLSSDSLDNTIESKVGSIVTSELQKGKTSISKGKDDTCAGKANRTLYKCEGLDNDGLMRAHVKSASSTGSQAYNYSGEVEGFDTGDYVAFSKKDTVRQVDRRQEKIIDVSDNESDEVTVLEDHVDDFTLSGPKSTYKLPGTLAKMLYPHQREGLKWLWSLHCKGKGGILGDDMGLGKTMQICSFIAGLFHSNLVRRVLVVAPKTLLAHWINELSTVGLSEKTREYFATCTKTRHYELQYVLQDKGVLLTTYDIVRNNAKSLCGDYHYNDDGDEDETTWDYMILDEELWALFNFCCPELLGDKKEFKEKYEHYINRGNEKNASDREKRIGSAVAKELRECIQPFFLRRLKSEVFHDDTTLSKKNEIIVWLRLTRCQRQLYEAFLKSEIVLSACDGSPLAALTILKKICDHPLLLTKRAAEDVLEGMDSIVDQEDHRVAERLAMHIADVAERFDIVENHDISCKISFILSLLGDLVPKGHNVLIFSQTRKMLNLIQESLISNHYKYIRIDGTTKASDRAKIVKDFQEGRGAPIFLLTTQVGGLGLTLTNADRVIVVDPAWNPSTDNQSVDRAYRIGQKKDVIVYRLMTCGTVEEKIYRKQVFKGGLFRSATEHKEQIRYFSQQDLRDLFSLPKQGFDISPTQQQLLEEHDHQHTMEESLRAHVEFLETLNIAGISQHNLLFSKAAPLQAVEIEEEAGRSRGSRFMGNPQTRSSIEHNVDGAHYAFNPKDIKKIQKNSDPDVRKPSEDEIIARISRLSQIFADKAAVSRLPDKGEKIYRQITSLNLQLDQLQMAKRNKEDVIEL
ncbi:UNVERIFIED_CONTAM: protein CHROMATIN REMODELING 24 [Sesamum radiatum]|uniref:Protein CHROMATIN REMODELING 24 n=1 Tax=Sesamum radiatum TaxID=300843 RepID=A0AAW2VJF9_SESRA